MTLVNLKTLMTSAGVLALTTGFAAAAPAVVQSSVNLRAGPGTEYEVIAAMPGGASVDVMGCSRSWCQVNFDGTPGFASRGYLDIGIGAATGPAYERGYAYGTFEPGYRYGYRSGYTPGYGYSESSGYGASVTSSGQREFRGERRGLRDEREIRSEGREGGARTAIRGEGREGGERTAVRGEQRGQGQTAGQVQGNNPMLNPKTEAAAGRGPSSGQAAAIGGNNPMKNEKTTTAAGANEGSRSAANPRGSRGNGRSTTGAGANQ